METEFVNIFKLPMTLISRVSLTAEEQSNDNIKPITIGQFLDPMWQYQYIGKIQQIRALCPNLEEKLRNKPRVDPLKISLPAGIMSGMAVDGIGEANIVQRNAVAQIDIDAKDHPEIHDWEAVKATLSQSPYIAYLGKSVTGLGVFGLIAVEDAMRHEEHYEAIIADFANTTFSIMQQGDSEPTILHGIKLDQSQKNIAAKRFVSYDPQPYWNTEAQVYTKVIEPIKLYEPRYLPNYGGAFDIEKFFQAHNISYTSRLRQGGTQYIVTCPWSELHSSRSKAESAVFVNAAGVIGYKCMHAHCADKHWHQYREYYEPDAYQFQTVP